MITTKDTPENMSLEDMAYELAEYDYLHMPINEILATYGPPEVDPKTREGRVDIQQSMDMAYAHLIYVWTLEPEDKIRTQYAQLVREVSDYEM